MSSTAAIELLQSLSIWSQLFVFNDKYHAIHVTVSPSIIERAERAEATAPFTACLIELVLKLLEGIIYYMIMSRIWAAVVTVLVLQYMGVVSGQLVTTNSGQLLGHRLESRGGYQYYSYKGIPYAEKPERFQVSVLDLRG